MREDLEEMPEEIDSQAEVRGRMAGHFAGQTRLVALDADVSEAFTDAAEGNCALRLLIQAADQVQAQRMRKVS